MEPEFLANQLGGHLEEFLSFYVEGLFCPLSSKRKIEEIRQVQTFLRQHPSDWFKRSNQDGHITGSAFVIDPTWEHVVLVHHKKLGKWLQPGGHFEEAVLPHETALREVVEETGLADLRIFDLRTLSFSPSQQPLLFDLDIHKIPGRLHEKEHLHLDIRYLMMAQTKDLACSDESNEIRWIPLNQIEKISQEESIRHAIAKLSLIKKMTLECSN